MGIPTRLVATALCTCMLMVTFYKADAHDEEQEVSGPMCLCDDSEPMHSDTSHLYRSPCSRKSRCACVRRGPVGPTGKTGATGPASACCNCQVYLQGPSSKSYTLTEPNTYVLCSDVNSVNIAGNNIALNLNSHSILKGVDLGTNHTNITISGGLIGSNKPNATTDGIAGTNCTGCFLDNLYIANMRNGINLQGCSNNYLSNIECNNNSQNGLNLLNHKANNSSNNNMYAIECNGNGGNGIELNGGATNQLNNITCNGNTGHGLHIYYGGANTINLATCNNNGNAINKAAGIFLEGSGSNKLNCLSCVANYNGIVIYANSNSGSIGNQISSAACIRNTYCGIELLDLAVSNKLSDIKCDNNQYGIAIFDISYSNAVSDFCLLGNTEYGIIIGRDANDGSYDNTVSNGLINNEGNALGGVIVNPILSGAVTPNYVDNVVVRNSSTGFAGSGTDDAIFTRNSSMNNAMAYTNMGPLSDLTHWQTLSTTTELHPAMNIVYP